jgi:hypothetical protein
MAAQPSRPTIPGWPLRSEPARPTATWSNASSTKEVDDGIWLASFMHYDHGYFDLEQKTLQPLDNPFGTRLSPMS